MAEDTVPGRLVTARRQAQHGTGLHVTVHPQATGAPRLATMAPLPTCRLCMRTRVRRCYCCYVSAYCYICVVMLLCVLTHCRIYVRLLLYVYRHTAIYLAAAYH